MKDLYGLNLILEVDHVSGRIKTKVFYLKLLNSKRNRVDANLIQILLNRLQFVILCVCFVFLSLVGSGVAMEKM